MTIDEIITAERDNAEFSKANGYDKSADYHKQIAEWLEELKMYKSLAPRELVSEKQKNDRAIEYSKGVEYGFKTGYKNAIDDLLEDANEMAIEVDTGTYTMKAIGMGLLEQIAEQLKAGVNK